jgi:hypothetical protein
MILSVIGLVFDLIGVILLFKYGILPTNLWDHILMDNGMSERDEEIHKRWSRVGLVSLILGFSLQLVGTIVQNLN